MKYFPLFFLLLILACTPEAKEEKYWRHVGDIQYDPETDPPLDEFSPCEEYYSFQYYNFEYNGLKYKGEKPQLVKEIMEQFKAPSSTLESGFVTVRFLVNCKGETGFFRVYEMDKDYRTISFKSTLPNQLKNIVAGLKGWEIKHYKGEAKDYHQYLTFKIVDNQIKSIVP